VLGVLGRGSYADVYLARLRREPDKRVALKVLRREFLSNAGVIDRTRDEARVLSLLDHRHILRMRALHDYDGRPVVELELVEGIGLDTLLLKHPEGLPPKVALAAVAQIADALEYAYVAPGPEAKLPLLIVHRDVKPSNVLLSVHGVCRVIDFGVAKASFRGRRAQTIVFVHGSPGYCAPERRNEGTNDPAGDVYSLGVTAFELLTGKMMVLPTKAERHAEAVQQQLAFLEPKGLSPERVQEVRDLLTRMLSHDPLARPSHGEVVAALDWVASKVSTLPSFAAQHVYPLWDARLRKLLTPEADRCAFLQDSWPTPKRMLGEDEARAQVAAFLASEDWGERQPELKRLVAACSKVPTDLFLDVLERGTAPSWKLWVKRPPTSQVAAALLILASCPSPRLMRAARTLSNAGDEPVAQAARFVLKNRG
jgi:serine/threonine protein kinase